MTQSPNIFTRLGRPVLAIDPRTGRRAASQGALPWRPMSAGAHLIRVIDDHGRSAARDVVVTRQGGR